ncbi:MAG: NRDE family protein [Opitutaceae bacterium]
MCTVSWRRGSEGDHDLFFNRDELNTRAPELPPAGDHAAGVAWLAPRDGDRGGTWLLVNEFGLTVCLLNDYGNPWRPATVAVPFSRGHVVLACAAATRLAEVAEAVNAQPLRRCAPFQLVALSPDEGLVLLQWGGGDGLKRTQTAVVPPLSSSSYATDAVIAARVQRFGQFVRNPASTAASELSAYHRHHDSAAGAESVLMRRPDAATRSICHVRVDQSRVRLDYSAVRWSAAGAMIAEPISFVLTRRAPGAG